MGIRSKTLWLFLWSGVVLGRTEVAGVPENDAFAGRSVIEGGIAVLRGSTVSASIESGEPEIPGVQADVPRRSVWFTWTAPASGPVVVSRHSDHPVPFEPYVSVFEGESLDQLHRLVSDRDTAAPAFQGEAGHTYQLAVSGIGDPTQSEGRFALNLCQTTAAIVEPSLHAVMERGRRIFVRFEGEPPPLAGEMQVWYLTSEVWLPAIVWSGRPVREVDLDPLPASSGSLEVRWLDAEGRQFRTPAVPIRIAPDGDQRTSALVADGTSWSMEVDFRGSGLDLGETAPEGGVSGTVWVRWQAPETGRLIFNPGGGIVAFELATAAEPVEKDHQGRAPIQKGTEYWFRLWQTGGTLGTAPVSVAVVVNDDFGDRQVIPLSGEGRVSLEFQPAFATQEPGEPGPLDSGATTAWWAWTAPADGRIRYDAGSVQAFRGDVLSELVSQGPNEDLLLTVAKGTRYAFRALALSWQPAFRWSLDFLPAPVNLIPERAEEIGDAIGTLTHSFEWVAPDPESWVKARWYRFDAPTNGVLQVGLVGVPPGVDFLVAGVEAYRRLQPALEPFAYDFTDDGRSLLVPLATGQPAWLKALSSKSPNTDRFALHWEFLTPPDNNDFARRQRSTSAQFTHRNDLRAATVEVGEPIHYEAPGFPQNPGTRKTVWYQWTPPTDGQASFAVQGEGFVPVLGVYTGNSLRQLRAVARSAMGGNPPDGYASIASVPVQAGTPYSIAVDGPGTGSSGPFELVVDLTTLTLTDPRPEAMLLGGESLRLAINQPLLSVDGTLTEVTYVSAGVAPGSTIRTLGVSREPPFDLNVAELPLAAGRHALFAVASNTAGQSRLSPAVFVSVRPANDSWSRSQSLTGFGPVAVGSLVNATRENAEPGSGAPSVWFHWTAPFTASTRYRISGPDSLRVDIYTGESLAQMKRQPAFRGNEDWQFSAQMGVTYRIQIHQTPNGPATEFTLALAPQFDVPVVEPGTLRLTAPGTLSFTPWGQDDRTVRLRFSTDLSAWGDYFPASPFPPGRPVEISLPPGMAVGFFQLEWVPWSLPEKSDRPFW